MQRSPCAGMTVVQRSPNVGIDLRQGAPPSHLKQSVAPPQPDQVGNLAYRGLCTLIPACAGMTVVQRSPNAGIHLRQGAPPSHLKQSVAPPQPDQVGNLAYRGLCTLIPACAGMTVVQRSPNAGIHLRQGAPPSHLKQSVAPPQPDQVGNLAYRGLCTLIPACAGMTVVQRSPNVGIHLRQGAPPSHLKQSVAPPQPDQVGNLAFRGSARWARCMIPLRLFRKSDATDSRLETGRLPRRGRGDCRRGRA